LHLSRFVRDGDLIYSRGLLSDGEHSFYRLTSLAQDMRCLLRTVSSYCACCQIDPARLALWLALDASPAGWKGIRSDRRRMAGHAAGPDKIPVTPRCRHTSPQQTTKAGYTKNAPNENDNARECATNLIFLIRKRCVPKDPFCL
jgi:hypothetical protein